MSEKFKSILKSWGLEYLIQLFEDEGIDDTAFDLLDEQTMKELIPKKGSFLIFRSKYEQYKNKKVIEDALKSDIIIDSLETASNSTSTARTVTISDLGTPYYSSDVSNDSRCFIPELDAILNSEEQSNENACPNLTPIMRESKTKRPSSSLFINYMSLEDLLRSSTEGRILLAKKQKLTNDSRQKLVNLIIDELINECLRSKQRVELKTEKLIEIAESIQELFVGEDKNTYYIPYSSKRDSLRKQPARGKLWYRYLNIKAQLRLINKEKISTPEVESESFTVEEQQCLVFLKTHSEPYHDLLINWEATFDIRKSIYSECEIQTLFNDIKCSDKDYFLNLLETDFNRDNPGRVDIIYSQWPKVFPAILRELEIRRIAVAKEFNSHELDPQTQAFSHLAYLFSPSNIKGKNFHWRPSRTEVQDSIFCVVKDDEELEERIKRRKLFLDKGDLPLQPFAYAVVVLEEITFFIHCYGKKYKIDVQNCTRCIELLYKLYQTLNLEYPPEGKSVWNLVQELVFDTPCKEKNSSTSSVLSDIKHHLMLFFGGWFKFNQFHLCCMFAKLSPFKLYTFSHQILCYV
ncbi:uncharacterized protein LOC123314457 [Coccinella septempunctata]|uniref:uncharacterized protein LOC123313636 n=1 Tax=Coccinella septempunctata TaxID=41139 RepID=UPI001D08FA99|nr:uncharacterized protein LOC123313636 [Coccinella septempunctata]XP_044755695.1 uncharacterized protein LOC123314455 [Coccinella septempunctata]XP_044755696.1 uncharacterized protein LOC123314457 [Coccinella septempunctata]